MTADTRPSVGPRRAVAVEAPAPDRPGAWYGRGRNAVEIGVRVLLAALVWWLLAPVFWHDVVHFERVTDAISSARLPYRDFLWEFPPLSLAPVLVARIGGSLFPLVFVALMIASEYGSLVLLRRRFPHAAAGIGRWWHLTVLPLATFTWFRLDFLAVFAATAGLVAVLGAGRAARWVVLGFAVKFWPAVLVIALLVRRRAREAVLALAGCGVVLAAWWLWSPGGFGSFLTYRRGAGLQVESTAGAVLLLAGRRDVSVVSGAWVVGSGGWGWVDPAGLLLVAAVTVFVVLLARRRAVDVVRICGALTVLLVVSGRILSPQYLVWAAPFVVLLAAGRDRVAAVLYSTAVALTLAPLLDYDAFLTGHPGLLLCVLVRNLALWLLAAHLLGTASTGPAPDTCRRAEAPDAARRAVERRAGS